LNGKLEPDSETEFGRRTKINSGVAARSTMNCDTPCP